jgi:hypothetical protein
MELGWEVVMELGSGAMDVGSEFSRDAVWKWVRRR